MQSILPIFGILFLLFCAALLSEDRKSISKSLVFRSIALQFVFAILILGIPRFEIPGVLGFLFAAANAFFTSIVAFADEGAVFVFSKLSVPKEIGAYIFAFKVLPIIIFFSALMALLYHMGVIQKLIMLLSKVMQKALGISAVESLSSAANIFIGQIEAPLVVKPYLSKLTKSELVVLMVGGFATIAGSVMGAFISQLQSVPGIAGHLLTASVISAPAAIMVAKMIVPEKEEAMTSGLNQIPEMKSKSINALEAVSNGAMDGLKVAFGVAAMLIAIIALVAMLNAGLEILGNGIGFSTWGKSFIPQALLQEGELKLSLQIILGILFSPLAYLLGIPWQDCLLAGALFGEKMAINEFYAYIHLSQLMEQMQPRSVIICSYALCGFANFSSIGMQIGGISSIEPSLKPRLAKFGFRAMLGGSIAAFLTAAIAALLIE